jgi:hypothetical protein
VKAFPDAEYFDVTADKNRILLVPVKITRADAALESIRDKMKKLAITEEDIARAVKWARKRKKRIRVILDTNVLDENRENQGGSNIIK